IGPHEALLLPDGKTVCVANGGILTHPDYGKLELFDTAGIGPHEALLLPDGKTVCVANGGILTHPDYGKLEL
ncbi:Tat pathway signal protein, partial [Bordetella pertussis]